MWVSGVGLEGITDSVGMIAVDAPFTRGAHSNTAATEAEVTVVGLFFDHVAFLAPSVAKAYQ